MKPFRVRFLAVSFLMPMLLLGCGASSTFPEEPLSLEGHAYCSRVPLQYAKEFTLDRYEGDFSVLSVSDGCRYLILPAQADAPANFPEDIRVLRRPKSVYLAATAVMSFLDALDCVEEVRLSGTTSENWSVPSARNAMEKGEMLYAGKYSTPDYELLLTEHCDLAVESSMILHTPEVREKLEELGIPVLMDYSSYEEHPLGRCEWVKVYGELFGCPELAESRFVEQLSYLEEDEEMSTEKKTVAFFYINSAGQIVTRRPGDYISRMLELAGGRNVLPKDDSDSANATMTMETEAFFTVAKDADIILYNSTIEGELSSLETLIERYPLLADFRAVQNHQVFCTRENLYQDTMHLGAAIAELRTAFSGGALPSGGYLYALQ